jgi:hypothetical protein
MKNLRSNENKANLQSLIEKTCVIYKKRNKSIMHRDGDFYNKYNEHELYAWENSGDNEYNFLKTAGELKREFNNLSPEKQLNIRYALNWFN